MSCRKWLFCSIKTKACWKTFYTNRLTPEYKNETGVLFKKMQARIMPLRIPIREAYFFSLVEGQDVQLPFFSEAQSFMSLGLEGQERFL
jgi:hypothetical protein